MSKTRELHWAAMTVAFVAGSLFHQAVRELWPVMSAIAATGFTVAALATQPKDPSR